MWDRYLSNIFPLAKNSFWALLFLKVSLPHTPTGQEYFLGFLFSKIPVQHVGQILLNIRKHRKYSLPVGICWTGIFEKKKP
jgi:hypothetical protein